MNPFKWLEKATFLGEVIKDYGISALARSSVSEQFHMAAARRLAAPLASMASK